MLRFLRFAFATLVILAVAGPATSAFAAPIGWQAVNVTLHTEQQQSTILVSGELPASTALPFETELAVPTGTQLQWIGELLGGPPSEDPELKFVKSTVEGMDVYRFTLTKSRTAQVEAVAPGVSVPEGANQATTLKWTAWRALPEVSISARIPAGAQIVRAAPDAELRAGEQGWGYYSKTVKNPKAGDVLDLTFAYAAPAAGSPAAVGSTGSDSSPAVLLIVLLVLVGAAAILVLGVRRKMAVKAAADESDEYAQDSGSDAVDAASVDSEPQSADGPRSARKVKPAVAVFGVLGLLIVGVVAAVSLATSTPTVDGKITKFFGAASPCTSATIAIVANEGVDLSSQGTQLVDAFTGQQDIGDVTLDITRSTVDVAFCESSQSEASIGKILTDTGLVTVVKTPASSVPETSTPQ